MCVRARARERERVCVFKLNGAAPWVTGSKGRKNECFKWKKNRAPSSILHEAKLAYYARNMFEAARLVFS